jgi:hypothetical protein
VRAPRAPVAVRVVARGAGYRSVARLAGEPVHVDTAIVVAIRPPARVVTGEVCLVAQGGPIELVGTAEARSQSPAVTTVDGQPVALDAALRLLEGRRASALSRATEITSRASDLTGGLVPGWLLFAVMLVLTAGAIAGVPLVLARAAAEDP